MLKMNRTLQAQKVQQAKWQGADREIRAQIGALKGKSDLTLDEIGTAIGVSCSTIYKRYHDPATFTLCELRRLSVLCKRYEIDFDPML